MKRFAWVAIPVMLVAVLAAGKAAADGPIYITKIKGATTGEVKGGEKARGFEGAIPVYFVSHEIVSPRDPSSGLPTGRRQHKPLVLTTALDRSTPLLERMLIKNEVIPTVEIKFFRPAATGKMECYYIIRLTNANIASVRAGVPDARHPENATLPIGVDVTFTYQRIEWIWVDGNITTSDDWEAPAA